jgi:hypothetical protein
MHASRYQIVVSRRLGSAGREAFRDFHFEPNGMDSALTGDLNPSALFDVLTRMRGLALDPIGLTCLAPGPDMRLAE